MRWVNLTTHERNRKPLHFLKQIQADKKSSYETEETDEL